MASIAQEESRSISQNVTVGKRWAMQEGKVQFAYSNFLGYKKVDGKIVIDKEQAELVTRIYTSFLRKGMSCTGIAEMLNKEGIPTPSGKEGTRWTKNNIYSILTNEKYKGDALLQKTYIQDYLDHKAKINKGEIAQYYVENSHEAIILKDEWQMVQTELTRRKGLGARYSSIGPFASKLICEDCGGFYGSKVWHSNDKFRKVVFQCNNKFKDKENRCKTPHLTEEEIKCLFVKAYNIAMKDKTRLLQDTKEVIDLLTDTTPIDKDIASLNTEAEVLIGLVNKMIEDNSRVAQSQEEYETKYESLRTKYNKVAEKIDKLQQSKLYKMGQSKQLNAFLKQLETAETTLNEWSEDVWMMMVENGVVHRNKSITFKFYNGKEITVE